MDPDSSGADIANFDSQSCASFDSGSNCNDKPSSSKSSRIEYALSEMNFELMTSEEMVDFIVGDPDKASQAISKLMRTPTEAISTLEKIINSQKDALKLISHLIAYPGDGLKIISKIMNSPFNALTVFTKFMSSPTDALELISKVVSSPQDVLNFIKNLMDSPEDALNIMNKFMNTPAEALKIINKLFNGSNTIIRPDNDSSDEIPVKNQNDGENDFQSPTSPVQQSESSCLPPPKGENAIIYSMLNSSPSETQVYLPPLNAHLSSPLEPTLAFTSPHHIVSLTSPISIANADLPYGSPTTSVQTDELPSTSAGLAATSPTNITNDGDFIEDQFDIKAFMQNTLSDNTTNSDSINSFESVLSEVIRIEFQAFNNLPPEPRVKHEMYTLHTMQAPNQSSYTGCHQKQHIQIQQEEQNQAHYQNQQHNVICSPSSVTIGRDLNETEQTKLRELKLASEALYYPLDDDISMLMMNDVKPEDSNQYQNLLQVINLTAVAIKRLIKMAKKITAFRDMCQEDQVALLKGGCTEMMLIRSVMTYDDNRNIWKIPHTIEAMTNVNVDVLKLAKGNLYEEHLNFIRTFDEKWRLDENIILIMCAIVLFTPSRPRIIHSDVITLEQNSYYYLLRRYLESVYPGCEAKSTFMKLIKKISDVERLNRTIIGVYLNVNPAEVEPLLREIFDLKNH